MTTSTLSLYYAVFPCPLFSLKEKFHLTEKFTFLAIYGHWDELVYYCDIIFMDDHHTVLIALINCGCLVCLLPFVTTSTVFCFLFFFPKCSPKQGCALYTGKYGSYGIITLPIPNNINDCLNLPCKHLCPSFPLVNDDIAMVMCYNEAIPFGMSQTKCATPCVFWGSRHPLMFY